MSPGQDEEVEGQGTGQPGPLGEGGPGAYPEAPPVGPPPNSPEAPGGPLEGTEEAVQADAEEAVELPPHMNLWVHNCGTVTAGAPPAKCPGCQRLSPEGEWLLYKVALV